MKISGRLESQSPEALKSFELQSEECVDTHPLGFVGPIMGVHEHHEHRNDRVYQGDFGSI